MPAALSDASDCVALDATWPKGLCRKGAAHYALNDFGAAVEAYEAALKLTHERALRQYTDAKGYIMRTSMGALFYPGLPAFLAEQCNSM